MAKAIHKTNMKPSLANETLVVDQVATAELAGTPEEAPSSGQQPAQCGEDEIRTVAYGKWESAGFPAGDGVEFWLEAERELNTESARSRPAHGQKSNATQHGASDESHRV